MQSKAATVADYLRELTPERRAAVEAVRAVVNANRDPRLQEGMQYGMIGWYVPHSVFPLGYHGDPKQPLPYACLASQKNHLSLYLMTAYADGTAGEAWIRSVWPKDKKLDMGKSCIRFRRVEDLALDVIGEALRRVPVDEHLAWYARFDPRQRPHAAHAPKKTATKQASVATKPTAKNAAAKKAAKARPAKKK